MSVRHYHGLCERYRGKAVEIRTNNGGIHRGIIRHVDGNRVYLQPIRRRNLGGFGYGYYRRPRYGYGRYGRYGYGYGGFGAGIALGTIAALALLPAFYW
ncbi:hypothetical protein [Virgibacillus sp. DJP39]|uniref:hypothetical protein n=1 Tax=Virgibacillus sp. DJP39 TaxID=3409790 RepID=UPI003BB49D35